LIVLLLLSPSSIEIAHLQTQENHQMEDPVKKNRVISRTIEIRGNQTLEDLHNVIFRAFNREDQHMYEFQIGGKGPNDPKARRYSLAALIAAESEESKIQGDVKQVTMDSLKLKKDQAFGYWFDFGDEVASN
jgi:hypothetical protein